MKKKTKSDFEKRIDEIMNEYKKKRHVKGKPFENECAGKGYKTWINKFKG